MKASERRKHIYKKLQLSQDPIKATQLAGYFGVSRQVIVSDIALLRASDYDILATNQGYILAESISHLDNGRYRGKLACQHSSDQAIEELALIVSLGGEVEDVIVDHPFYGILKASLRIRHQSDIQEFQDQMTQYQGEMLSSLTDGIHVHTITTPSVKEFKAIKEGLSELNILIKED